MFPKVTVPKEFLADAAVEEDGSPLPAQGVPSLDELSGEWTTVWRNHDLWDPNFPKPPSPPPGLGFRDLPVISSAGGLGSVAVDRSDCFTISSLTLPPYVLRGVGRCMMPINEARPGGCLAAALRRNGNDGLGVLRSRWRAYEASRYCQDDINSTVRMSATERAVLWRIFLPGDTQKAFLSMDGAVIRPTSLGWTVDEEENVRNLTKGGKFSDYRAKLFGPDGAQKSVRKFGQLSQLYNGVLPGAVAWRWRGGRVAVAWRSRGGRVAVTWRLSNVYTGVLPRALTRRRR